MSSATILSLGFLLGLRHAMDADHIAAVSAIVGRERSIRSATPIGLLWGLGHAATLVGVGGALILLGLTVPPDVSLSLEGAVAVMLIILGSATVLRDKHKSASGVRWHARSSSRPVVVGVIHGLAGSAAVALLAVTAVEGVFGALWYLVLFAVGTVVGMGCLTAAFAASFLTFSRQFSGLQRWFRVAAGITCLLVGVLVLFQVGSALWVA